MPAMIVFCLSLLTPLGAAADEGAKTPLEVGIAAYEAEDYERAHALLSPLVAAHAEPDPDGKGGPVEARYLMARLLSGDLPDRQDMGRALALLDPTTRCSSADALNLYAFILDDRDTTRNEDDILRYALLYKEAAMAGSTKALVNLGHILVHDFKRVFIGGSYILDASIKGHKTASDVFNQLPHDAVGDLARRRIQEIAEEQPIAARWPLLDANTSECSNLWSDR